MGVYGDALDLAEITLVNADNRIGYFIKNEDIKSSSETEAPTSRLYAESDIINLRLLPQAPILLTTNGTDGDKYSKSTHICRIHPHHTVKLLKEQIIQGANHIVTQNNKTQLITIWHIDEFIIDDTFDRCSVRMYLTQKIKVG